MSISQLVNLLHVISYLAMGVTLVSVPFMFINWTRYTTAKKREEDSGGVFTASFPTKSVGFFAGSVITGILCLAIVSYFATDATANFLNSLSGEYSVKINNVTSDNPAQVVKELKKVGFIMAHHSHPTKTIRVEIKSSNGELVLDLRRDSDTPYVYWVFNPAFDDRNEIGKITTRIFDQY